MVWGSQYGKCGAYNFEVASSHLENLWSPGTESLHPPDNRGVQDDKRNVL